MLLSDWCLELSGLDLWFQVNFSKKRRNRMRNDEAAIIALCRSKSQNLSGMPLDLGRDGIVSGLISNGMRGCV